jgi:protocatechuate 3,4-dioxygenase beta subunit
MKKTITALLSIIFAAIFGFSAQSALAKINKERPVISGVVTDTNGVPIEGVEVTAKSGSMGSNFYRLVSPNTWTDENGHFNLPVEFPDISYNVTFRYMFNNSCEMKIIPDQAQPLKVQLAIKTSQIVRGVVVNGSDLSPVPGATVRYFGEYQKFVLEKKTDEKGQFEFTMLPFSESQGVIYAQSNSKVSDAMMVRYTNSKQPVNLQIKLDSGSELWGIVKSESDDKPIKNCTVSISTYYMSGYSLQTTTDANGLYRFRDLPPAEYKINAQNENYFKEEQPRPGIEITRYPSSGQKIEHNLKLKKKVTFEGKVVDLNGKPVEGAIVAIDEAHVSENKYSPFVVHTDEKGKFSITTGRIDNTKKPELRGIDALKQLINDYLVKSPAGEDAIEAFSSAGFGRVNFSPFNEGEVINGVRIILNGVVRVHGKVTDPNGFPVKDVKICDSSGFDIYSQTDEQGRFDLGKIPVRWPDKKQRTIEFLAPRPESSDVVNYRAAKIKDSDAASGKVVFYHHKKLNYNFEPQKDVELNVILEPSKLITLQGTVLYESGSPAANAVISLFTGNADKNTWLQTVHPDVSGGRLVIITDCVICTARTDAKGHWKMVMAKETKEGIKLAYWQERDPNLFSIGVETPDKKTVLIQDIIIDKDTTEKEINIKLENESEFP